MAPEVMVIHDIIPLKPEVEVIANGISHVKEAGHKWDKRRTVVLIDRETELKILPQYFI